MSVRTALLEILMVNQDNMDDEEKNRARAIPGPSGQDGISEEFQVNDNQVIMEGSGDIVPSAAANQEKKKEAEELSADLQDKMHAKMIIGLTGGDAHAGTMPVAGSTNAGSTTSAVTVTSDADAQDKIHAKTIIGLTEGDVVRVAVAVNDSSVQREQEKVKDLTGNLTIGQGLVESTAPSTTSDYSISTPGPPTLHRDAPVRYQPPPGTMAVYPAGATEGEEEQAPETSTNDVELQATGEQIHTATLVEHEEVVEAEPALKGFKAIVTNRKFKYLAALFLIVLLAIVIPVAVTSGGDEQVTLEVLQEPCGTREKKQSDYRGTINVTSTGKTCQAWAAQGKQPWR